MAAYVVFTVFLFQKGSSESKDPTKSNAADADPRAHRQDRNAPWPVKKGGLSLILYEHSLSVALFVLFLISFMGHVMGGSRLYNEDRAEHGQAAVSTNTRVTYEKTKPFARAVAEWLAQESPERVVSQMQKNLRAGKVLVDWSQNDNHKTTVNVYSLRAKERPTVSTPVTWDEVKTTVRRKCAKLLHFEASDVMKRLEKRGDLFASVLTLKQKLPRSLGEPPKSHRLSYVKTPNPR